jgi:hypothetical protein
MLKPKRANRVVGCLVCWPYYHGRMGLKHFGLKDGGAVCSLCGTKNPLGNLQKMSIQEVTEPLSDPGVFHAGRGTAAHALHYDCRTVLGPWIKFTSARRWIGHSSISGGLTI